MLTFEDTFEEISSEAVSEVEGLLGITDSTIQYLNLALDLNVWQPQQRWSGTVYIYLGDWMESREGQAVGIKEPR